MVQRWGREAEALSTLSLRTVVYASLLRAKTQLAKLNQRGFMRNLGQLHLTIYNQRRHPVAAADEQITLASYQHAKYTFTANICRCDPRVPVVLNFYRPYGYRESREYHVSNEQCTHY